MAHISERESGLPEAMIGQLIEFAVERKDVISLGPGEPDFDMPAPLVSYARRMANKCNHYSPPAGRKELREALAKKLKKDNKIRADPENIIITTGSQEGLLLALACSIDVSEEIVLPTPAFLGYLPTVELLNGVVREVPLRASAQWQPFAEDIEAAITKKTQAIILNTPSNPTGSVLTKKTLEELADIAVEHDLYIFSDEAYEKIIYDAKHVSPAALNGMHGHVVTLQTFSKSYAMAGYRVGYVVAPPKLARAIEKIHVYSTIGAPTVSQLLAVQALKLPKRYVDSMVREYRRRRDMIVRRLNSIGLATQKPQGAFYAFASISQHKNKGKTSLAFARSALKNAKVAVVPGSEFGRYGEGFVRCSYATHYNLIEKAMDRLEKFLRE